MAEIICMPKLGNTMESGVLSGWTKAVGDKVNKGDPICDIETEKLVTAVESMMDGVMLAQIAEAGGEYAVGEPICIIGEAGENIEGLLSGKALTEPDDKAGALTEEKKAEIKTDISCSGENRIKISPLARKIAKREGVDYSELKGSGNGGRVIKRDILAALESGKNKAAATPPAASDAGTDVTERMNSMRRTIAARMSESKSTIPHTYFKTDVDMTEVMEFRKRAPKHIEPEIEKYGVNELILKAAAIALRSVKGINVSVNGDELTTHSQINLGMAVSVPNGLIVPVIKNVDKLTIGQIGKAAAEFAVKAREGRLSMDELSGSTFTVSSLGKYGIPEFTAIINPPNAAILAVGAVRDEVVPVDGQIAVRAILHATLSIDHRVIDGALAAQYLAKFKEILENPFMLLV